MKIRRIMIRRIHDLSNSRFVEFPFLPKIRSVESLFLPNFRFVELTIHRMSRFDKRVHSSLRTHAAPQCWLPIKKRITIELFIGRKAALCIGESQI